MSESTLVMLEAHGPNLVLALNDPRRLNALSPEMRHALHDALRDAADDESVRSIILTGAGRAFCSGGAMGSELVESAVGWMDFYEDVYSLMEYMRGYPKPIIAAVNGLCYAAGVILISYCDMVVASNDATFCYIEARMGMGGAGTAVHHVGPQWAKFLILTGEEISAQQAARIGLVMTTAAPDDLLPFALRIGSRIAAVPAHVAAMNKRHVNAEMDAAGWSASRDLSSLLYAVLNASLSEMVTPEGEALFGILRERGLRAFIEARDREFQEPLLSEE
jgi:enoyl-CoA hydratase/carnithine racemase